MKLVCLLILLLLGSGQAEAREVLEFGYIGAPLSYSSLSVLKEAYKKVGVTVVGRKLPAARALVESAAGKTDGEVHRIASVGKEYPSLLRIPVRVNMVEGIAVSCGKTVDTSSLDSVRNLRIGIKIGTRYVEKLTAGMPHVIPQVDEHKLMELLLAGRLDIVLGDRPWAMHEKMLPGNDCVRINEPPLVVIPLYHYLHRRHNTLVPVITDIMRDMEQSGERDRIIRRALEAVQGGVVPDE